MDGWVDGMEMMLRDNVVMYMPNGLVDESMQV